MISSTCKSAMANAVGGKTARACDSCVRRRARWYCAADDAFLCQSCDSSVHSANSLARRHQRLRLNSASSKPPPPLWHAGFTRKPRTPRPRPKHDSLVPEADETETETETTSPHDHDDPLLYCRVPTAAVADSSGNFHGLIGGLPPDLDDLEEFAADVESLLGRNLESECFDMEGLGLLDCKDELLDDTAPMGSSRVVKVEDGEDGCSCRVERKLEEVDLMRHHECHLNFHDYHHVAPAVIKNEITQQQQEQHRYVDESINATNENENKNENDNKNKNEKKRKLTLQLDCEAVIAAWGSQKSPWTAGERPDFLPDDDAWPDSMVQGVRYGQEWGMSGGQAAMGDCGREARVSRYREKRRTRLFSKKIRYEVRKLNAEKRPRMKGRFVKRTPPFVHPTLPILAIK